MSTMLTYYDIKANLLYDLAEPYENCLIVPTIDHTSRYSFIVLNPDGEKFIKDLSGVGYRSAERALTVGRKAIDLRLAELEAEYGD